MTRSRTRVFSALLLAALAAAAPRLRAQSAAAPEERRLILIERDPAAAERLLSDPSLQDRLRTEDETGSRALFRAATELRDLRELLRGLPENRVLRGGLAERPDCSFCQNIPEFLDWAARYAGAGEKSFLRAALYEWDTVPDERRKWLAEEGVSRTRWDAMRFVERHEKIQEWGKIQYEGLTKTLPKNANALAQYRDRINAVDDVLDHSDASTLSARLRRAEISAQGLVEAEKRLAATGDPDLRAALEAAREAPDLESRLSGLAKIFDGLGIHDPILNAAAPLKPGQGFDAKTRRLTSEILGTALMREVEGTWAGAELKAFYARHPLKITIKAEDGALATYSDGAMNFGRDEIETFLKGHSRQARDLLKDPALLRDLARELASVFVHEATHHRQDVWAQEQGIPTRWSQHTELEAMETEALFALEKARRDPSYKRYITAAAAWSTNARSTAELAERLKDRGPDWFRRTIQAWHYPELLSLEGTVWCAIVSHNDIEGDLTAELARRRTFAAKLQSAFKFGPAPKTEYETREEFREAARAASTGKLEAMLAAVREERRRAPEIYAKNLARYKAVNRATEERLKELDAEADPTKTRRPVVPPPSQENAR